MADKTLIDKVTDTLFGTEVNPDDGRVRYEGAGLVFSIYEAGEFKDETGKIQKFAAGIKISVGTRSVRLEPSQAAVLKNILAMPDVCQRIQARIDEENEMRKNLRM